MLRTFHEHDVRTVEPLDGRWEFAIASERRDRSRLPRRYPRSIAVPSVWEQVPGLENYRGRAWFRRPVPALAGFALRLVFGGVSHTGTVYVDGKKAGHHYDAFTPWEVVVPGLKTGSHELVVEVDNTFGPHSALHIPNDYMTYGGITRPVEMQYVPEVFIDQVFARPERNGAAWNLHVTVRLRNWSGRRLTRQVVVMLEKALLDFGDVTVPARGSREVRGVLRDLPVRAWTPRTPNLYDLRAGLLTDERIVDDKIDRVGFREVGVRGGQILLNGRPIRLRGYNRHEDHGSYGNAMPLEAQMRDLEILRDLGCNFVRTCHYPNDMRFLDLCDEMGFYVWEESHARTVDFQHPKFREQIEASTREMIEWHFNRPSIVLWGCLNECESRTPPGRNEHRRVIEQIRRLDSSRPVTFASNKQDEDISLGLADVVSWNVYNGWYRRTFDEIRPEIDRLVRWLDSPRSRGARGKPLIMSEFGGAALYGYRNPSRVKWTEDYQADLLDRSLEVYLNHRRISGVAIWQFCDCRVTTEGGFWGTRPRTYNNKGTLDEYRRPKLSYDTVRRRMREAARRWDRRGPVR